MMGSKSYARVSNQGLITLKPLCAMMDGVEPFVLWLQHGWGTGRSMRWFLKWLRWWKHAWNMLGYVCGMLEACLGMFWVCFLYMMCAEPLPSLFYWFVVFIGRPGHQQRGRAATSHQKCTGRQVARLEELRIRISSDRSNPSWGRQWDHQQPGKGGWTAGPTQVSHHAQWGSSFPLLWPPPPGIVHKCTVTCSGMLEACLSMLEACLLADSKAHVPVCLKHAQACLKHARAGWLFVWETWV